MNNEQTGSAAPASMPSAQRAGIRRAIIAAMIGTVIEWYDFALYGAAAGLIINKLFFPQLSAVGGTLAAFATFAVGFFIRPLGGIVVSHYGDRFGRKPGLIFTIVLMGASTAAMGLLPTYAQVGIAAPILLLATRLLQGFGAGAEYAGAVTLVAEYVPERHKGMMTGMLPSATVIGITLAMLSFLAASYAPEDILLGWTWRIPFLSSAVLFFVALYIRTRLEETPEYVAAMKLAAARHQEARMPLRELLRNSPRELFFGFLSITGHNANSYILSTFSLSYMTGTLGMPRSGALLAVLISSAVGVLTTPLMGAISDRVGYAKVYLFGAIFTLLYAFPMFALLGTRSTGIAILAMCIGYGLGFGGLAGSQGAFLANLFETRYRFSGIAITRELSGMLIAGPTPFIAAALVALAGGSPKWVVIYLMVCCALSIVAILAVKRRAIHSSTVQVADELAD
jgi:MFS family permease